MKAILRFSGKAFIFGIACCVFVALCGWAYWYYQNRTVPAKTWKQEEEKEYGVRFSVKTEWTNGKTKYELEVLPSDKDAGLPVDTWSSWQNENRKVHFTVQLMDAGNFAIDECSTERLSLSDATASGTPGKLTSLTFEGSLPTCSRHTYLSAASTRVTWNLPAATNSLSDQTPKTSASVPVIIKPDAIKSARAIHHLRARRATDINTQEYGNLACGHVEQGEIVILLKDDSAFVRVKRESGQAGWAGSGVFEVVD